MTIVILKISTCRNFCWKCFVLTYFLGLGFTLWMKVCPLTLVNHLCVACIAAESLWPHSAACIGHSNSGSTSWVVVMVCTLFHSIFTCVYVSNTAPALPGLHERLLVLRMKVCPLCSVNHLCIAGIAAESLWSHSAACIAAFSVYVANLYLLFIRC